MTSAALAVLLAANQKSSSSSSLPFLILIAVGAGFYFLILRPQSQRAKRQREAASQFEVGDEVLTAGGIVGTVLDVQGERVTLETSVGASFTVLKQYVVRKIEPPAPEGADGDEEGTFDETEEADGGGSGDADHADDDHEGPINPA